MPLIYVKKEVPFENCNYCDLSRLRWERDGDGVWCMYFGKKCVIKDGIPTRGQFCIDAEGK